MKLPGNSQRRVISDAHLRKASRQLLKLLFGPFTGSAVHKRINLLRKRLERLKFNTAGLKQTAIGAGALFIAFTTQELKASTTVTITNVSPTTNAIAAPRDGNIVIDFSHPMNSTTLNVENEDLRTVFIHGSQSGMISGEADIRLENDNKRLVILPWNDFFPGEEISITVTGASSESGYPLRKGYVLTFRAAVARSKGEFGYVTDRYQNNSPHAIIPYDNDRDGDIDLVLNNAFSKLFSLHNQGDFNFTQNMGNYSNVGYTGHGADLDNDGDIDPVMNQGGRTFYVYNNNRNGTYLRSGMMLPTSGLYDIKSGDLDGDGDMDLVTSNYHNGKTPYAFFNNGDGRFRSQALPVVNSREVFVQDFDSDGDVDIFMCASIGGSGDSKLLFNDGHGNFTTHTRNVDDVMCAGVGDFDGDGDLDIIAGTNVRSRKARYWKNFGNGNFGSSFIGDAGHHTDVEVGDLDGDGDLDAVLLHKKASTAVGQAQVLINDGTGRFQTASYGGFAFLNEDCALADFDGDGDLDLTFGGTNTGLQFYSNKNVPSVTRLNDPCLLITEESVELNLVGKELDVIDQVTLTIPAVADESLTERQCQLVVNSSTATTLATSIPAGKATNPGTYTLSLSGDAGEAEFEFEIREPFRIEGPRCVYPGQIARYEFFPSSAELNLLEDSPMLPGSSSWRRISADVFEVQWRTDIPGTLMRIYRLENGCLMRAETRVGRSTLVGNVDFLTTEPEATDTVDVLVNDTGHELELTKVFTPERGQARIVNNQVEFTAPVDFEGVCAIKYEARDTADCYLEGKLIVTVGKAAPNAAIRFVERKKDRVGGVRGLNRVEDVVVSPDGKHLYASGRNEHSLVLFNRSDSSGTLEYVKRYRHGRNGVRGLRYVSGLAISQDGAHVYAASLSSNSLAVFDRNDTTGELTFKFVEKMSGTAQPKGMAVSPNDKHIYITGSRTNALEVFERRSAADSLVQIQRLRDGRNGVDGLDAAADAVVSPDGRHVYVAAVDDDAVSIFKRDTTGLLTYRGLVRDKVEDVRGLSSATALSIRGDGKFLYVAGNQDDAVVVFERDPESGDLSFIQVNKNGQDGVTGLNAVSDVAVSPDNGQVYSAASSDRSIAQFSAGVTNGELSFSQSLRDGEDGVDGLKGAQALDISPDSKFIYVAGTSDNSVAVFRRIVLPTAKDDLFRALYEDDYDNSGLTFTLDVLANDFDSRGGDLTIVAVDTALVGDVSISAGGRTLEFSKPYPHTYADGIPADLSSTFRYTVKNVGGDTATANVEVMLSGPAELDKQARVATALTPASVPASALALIDGLSVAPNPSNGPANVSFRLNNDAHVTVTVCDMTGRQVAQLLNAQQSFGEYLIRWDGTRGGGQRLQSGAYYVVVSATNGELNTRQVFPIVLL